MPISTAALATALGWGPATRQSGLRCWAATWGQREWWVGSGRRPAVRARRAGAGGRIGVRPAPSWRRRLKRWPVGTDHGRAEERAGAGARGPARLAACGAARARATPARLSSPRAIVPTSVTTLSTRRPGRHPAPTPPRPAPPRHPPHLEQLGRLGAKRVRLAQVERAKVGVKRLVQLKRGGGAGVGRPRPASGASPPHRRAPSQAPSHQLVINGIQNVGLRKSRGREGGLIRHGGEDQAAFDNGHDLGGASGSARALRCSHKPSSRSSHPRTSATVGGRSMAAAWGGARRMSKGPTGKTSNGAREKERWRLVH